MSVFQASDNKLAMKLFGNRNALMKERLRHRAANTWVIHPCSDFRYVGSNVWLRLITLSAKIVDKCKIIVFVCLFLLYYFYGAMHYSAKRGLAIACRPSVCPSVCL